MAVAPSSTRVWKKPDAWPLSSSLKSSPAKTPSTARHAEAGPVADFFEFNELTCKAALDREESCGGHFRTEYQTGEGEALRNDDDYAYVSAWEYSGDLGKPILHKEMLNYENIKLAQRSYK